MKKFKYSDWLRGAVILKYDYVIPVKTKQPIVVSWENFDEPDKILIKREQERIFKLTVESLLSKFKNVFLSKYHNSLDKEILIQRELEQCLSILQGEFPENDLITTTHWGAVFKRSRLIEIQKYYSHYIVNGLIYNHENIHAEKSVYKNSNDISGEVYSQSLWEYLNWIKDLKNNTSKVKNRIESPVIKLFCAIIHLSGIIVKGDESAESFCKTVCKRFNLNYTDNVRKYFTTEVDISKKRQSKNLEIIVNWILPQIDKEVKKQIEIYIQSKNLYA